MLEGLGFTYNNQTPVQIVDASKHFNSKISKFRESFSILEEERIRKKELDRQKATVRIAAETEARQQGKSISQTDVEGSAADKVEDKGPKNQDTYNSALKMKTTMELSESLRLLENIQLEMGALSTC